MPSVGTRRITAAAVLTRLSPSWCRSSLTRSQ
jgi:hypothetical protein